MEAGAKAVVTGRSVCCWNATVAYFSILDEERDLVAADTRHWVLSQVLRAYGKLLGNYDSGGREAFMGPLGAEAAVVHLGRVNRMEVGQWTPSVALPFWLGSLMIHMMIFKIGSIHTLC